MSDDKVPVDWTPTNLGAVVAFGGGYGFPLRFQGHKDGDLPFFKVSDMSSAGNEWALVRANHYVSYAIATSNGWSPFPANSIAFAKVGAALLLNRRRMLVQPSLVDNNMMVAIPGPAVTSGFLYWWLQTVDFGIFVQPGALPSVNQSQLSALPLSLPPLSEQHRIAEILDTVDEAIRRTEKLIAKLKQIKAGLLHDLLTRGLDEEGRLRDPVANPEQFQETALGRLPAAWEIAALEAMKREDRPHLKTGPFGSSLKSEHWVDQGIPVITIGALGEGRIIESELLFVSEEKAQSLAAYAVRPGDLVFSRVADVGRSVVVSPAEDGWIMSSNLMRISLDQSKAVPAFVHLNIVHNETIRSQIGRFVNAGGRDIANTGIMDSLQFPWPKPKEQAQITEAVSAYDNRIRAEEAYRDKLTKLKKGLMQDLLTGRVRVTDVAVDGVVV